MREATAYLLRSSVLALVLAATATPAVADTYACAGDSIRVFAEDAGLESQPIRTITGPTAGVAECYAIALDTWHNEL